MDVETIAKGLSVSQRRWLLSGRQPAGYGKWPVQNSLVGKGLALAHPWRLTPLGYQVRAALQENHDANPPRP